MSTVAIACQGGGSHTAFTGGVLQRLLADGQHRIVALSGSSGGAVCALLAWYGLLTGGAAEAGRLLERFLQANSATTLSDRGANAGLVGLARLGGRGGPAAGRPPPPSGDAPPGLPNPLTPPRGGGPPPPPP